MSVLTGVRMEKVRENTGVRMEKVKNRTSTTWGTLLSVVEKVSLLLFIALEVCIPVSVVLFVVYLTYFR